MFKINVENTQTGEVCLINAMTASDAMDDLGGCLYEWLINTRSYVRQTEVHVLVQSMQYAKEQIETSNGDIQVFDVRNHCAGDMDSTEQLEMLSVLNDLIARFKSLTTDDTTKAIITE